PHQAAGSTVYYYIEANSVSGKTAVRPMPAPEGWWKFRINAASAVWEAPQSKLLDIYPNPASAITCIPVYTAAPTRCSIVVYNAFGQTVETVFEGQIPSGNSNYFIDAATYPSGAYFVELRAGDQLSVKKLVVR
ncbi:MAG TPA: T9SS type A sorting domain-containing protein, partial [Saprospiraceae bacterium]|nr:T9SS type A sorting domain-containing protein [Saprospiraceae bacterium]